MITTSASSKSSRSGLGSSSSKGTCRAGASPGGSLPGAGKRHVGHIGERARDLVGAYRRTAEHLPEAVLGHDQNAGWHARQCAKRRRLTSRRVPGDGYYANTRDDIVSALPKPMGAVLDVGCGSAASGPGLRTLREPRGSQGIEVVPEQAELARAQYDEVVAAPVEEALEQLEGPFDTILCLDVLEHLVDPELVHAPPDREVAAPGAAATGLAAQCAARLADEGPRLQRARSGTPSGAIATRRTCAGSPAATSSKRWSGPGWAVQHDVASRAEKVPPARPPNGRPLDRVPGRPVVRARREARRLAGLER